MSVSVFTNVCALVVKTVSLGKPSSAALEKLCSQTEVLLDETAAKVGGDAAFVDVREDFLLGGGELTRAGAW